MSSSDLPHNSHLLFIDQQCHSPQCYMVDFLPFTCEHCKSAFCADHYRPTAHACDKFDAAKHDRVAPSCPLCNTPVAIPLQQDPNVRMEQHIENECRVTTGKRSRPGNMPVCARGRCGKRLFAPIKCNSCGEQFCAAHRFPSAHTCSATAKLPAASTTPRPAAIASASAAGSKLVNKTSTAGATAIAAIKRNVANVGAPSPAPTAPASAPARAPAPSATSSAPKHTNPFSKTDRRAKAEQESRRRAMKERAKKGLLSEREQVILAEEEAALASESGKKSSDCVVM